MKRKETITHQKLLKRQSKAHQQAADSRKHESQNELVEADDESDS